MLVLVIVQAVQVLLLALSVFAFFVVFGAVAIQEPVMESWVGTRIWLSTAGRGQHRAAPGVDLPGGLLRPLLHRVAVNDDAYRREFFTVIMEELARAVSMRVIYRMLTDPSAADDG